MQYIELMKNIYDDGNVVAQVYLHTKEKTWNEKSLLLNNLVESLSVVLSDERIRNPFARLFRLPQEEVDSIRTRYAQLLQSMLVFSRESRRRGKRRCSVFYPICTNVKLKFLPHRNFCQVYWVCYPWLTLFHRRATYLMTRTMR